MSSSPTWPYWAFAREVEDLVDAEILIAHDEVVVALVELVVFRVHPQEGVEGWVDPDLVRLVHPNDARDDTDHVPAELQDPVFAVDIPVLLKQATLRRLDPQARVERVR